jgi:hypothetical protein
MIRTWLAATTAFAMMTGVAAAQTPPSSPSVGSSVTTSRGTGVVTGTMGSTATTTIPGSGGQGLITNNGNGTSMVTTPGHPPEAIGTPQ